MDLESIDGRSERYKETRRGLSRTRCVSITCFVRSANGHPAVCSSLLSLCVQSHSIPSDVRDGTRRMTGLADRGHCPRVLRYLSFVSYVVSPYFCVCGACSRCPPPPSNASYDPNPHRIGWPSQPSYIPLIFYNSGGLNGRKTTCKNGTKTKTIIPRRRVCVHGHKPVVCDFASFEVGRRRRRRSLLLTSLYSFHHDGNTSEGDGVARYP